VAQFRGQLRDQLLLSRIREREVDARVRVTDAEVDQFMRDEQLNSTAPPEINVAQILVAVPESATPEQITALQTKAQSALTRARANEDFGKLARDVSDAPDRANGGQLGLRAADRLPPLFFEATKNLNEGAITDVLRSGAGFHILKVVEKRAPGVTMVTQNRARHILLRSTAQMNEAQAREKLTDIRRRVQAGQADFATLARENSQDGSAPQGGDLGWSSPGQFVPEFEAVMDALQPNQISEPFVSRFGMHIIELVERRTVPLGLKEQREVIRSQLRDKKLDTAYAAWAQDVRGRAYVEMREPPLQ
jgi:peptidyl-prolyl cis-trans isomerase SurA